MRKKGKEWGRVGRVGKKGREWGRVGESGEERERVWGSVG